MLATKTTWNNLANSTPPQTWFMVSAVFHYLGPSFAVLLFPVVGVVGIAWMRIATASVVFAPWTKPLKVLKKADNKTRALLLGLGISLAIMNTSFYLALDKLPMSTVASMEFLGVIGLALYGMRTQRNLLAMALVALGVFTLFNFDFSLEVEGLCWALLNSMFFVIYIMLGHKIASRSANDGIELLGASMFIAFILLSPFGFNQAVHVFSSIELLLACFGVGICSSVIPYICDQLAMSRLPRASFALMLSILPVMATLIAVIVLAQVPTYLEMLGVVLVVFGVAIHDSKQIVHS